MAHMRSFTRRNLPLPALLTAGLVWSVLAGGLFAEERFPASTPSLGSQSTGRSPLLEGALAPRFQPQFQFDESFLGEPAQSSGSPTDSQLGADSIGEGGRSPFTARVWSDS